MKTAEPDLRHIALRLAGILGPDSAVLVGGLAVAVHGYSRATDDVDLLTRLDLKEARKRLRAEGIDTTLTRGDPLEGDFPCLQGTLEGVRFDILPELVPIDWERSLRLSVGGTELNVVDLASLVRLKLRAGGPQDLMDAAHLLLQHPEHLAKARELAKKYHLEEKLEIWLKDPRTQVQAEEERARGHERGRKRGSQGSPNSSRDE